MLEVAEMGIGALWQWAGAVVGFVTATVALLSFVHRRAKGIKDDIMESVENSCSGLEDGLKQVNVNLREIHGELKRVNGRVHEQEKQSAVAEQRFTDHERTRDGRMKSMSEQVNKLDTELTRCRDRCGLECAFAIHHRKEGG